MNNQEILDNYCDAQGYHCWEGERGIEQIHSICKDLGYNEQPWLFGDPLHQFLRDNPGVFQVILNWIAENMDDEQKENFIIEEEYGEEEDNS